MTDLFAPLRIDRPRRLADEMRPQLLSDIIGQKEILRPGSVLQNRVAAGRLGSIVLFGPTGTGKTTIARAIGATMNKTFRALHGSQNNIADVKKVVEEARTSETLLFLDEAQRFSANQIDSLLPFLEEGLIDFIAATTGNPYHDLTKGLISRSSVIRVEPLTIEDLELVVDRTVAYVSATYDLNLVIAPGLKNQIAARSGGDARRAITVIEGWIVGRKSKTRIVINQNDINEAYGAAPMPFDRNGDAHYDIISAYIKSMRGSDPSAALYWLARLIHSGEDPRYIARRLVVHASEDIGLADNAALQTAIAAQTAVETIGMPEAAINLAHATLHIARAPKSNSACRGIKLALEYVAKNEPIHVPPYLRDAHYAGAEALGHVGYITPHSTPSGWRDEDYAPGIKKGAFYQSDARDNPTFEKRADGYWGEVQNREQAQRFRKI